MQLPIGTVSLENMALWLNQGNIDVIVTSYMIYMQIRIYYLLKLVFKISFKFEF